MTTIRSVEILGLLNKIHGNFRAFSKAKIQANALVQEYVDENRKPANSTKAPRLFYQLIQVLDTGTLKEAALNKFELEYPQIFSEEQLKKTKFLRKRSATPDEIELDFSQETLSIYRQMGLVSKKNYDKFINSDLHEIDEFLKTIELKKHAQKLKFAEFFVRNHQDNLGVVPPIILAHAHESLKNKVDNGAHGFTEDLLGNIVIQIDDMTDQFATYENPNNFIPSSKSQTLSNFVDITNIARVYDGYRAIFEQRLKWFPEGATGALPDKLHRNITNIDRVMLEYDSEWNLDNFDSDEKSVSKRYQELKKTANSWNISDYAREQSEKYIFLGKNKKAISSSERLNQIIDLVRHETVLKNIAKPSKTINTKQLESDFNNAIILKLSEMAKDGGNKIEDRAYNLAKLDWVNQTADFAGRLNSKFESSGKPIETNLLPELFKPLESIDSRAKARFHDNVSDEYQSKIEFFKRIFKTFASSFLTSAAITAIALGVATVAGISLSAGIAVVGISSGIALSYFQIKKWQKQQIATGQGCGIRDLIADKRMLATLGTTGIAAIGMIFGAFGLTNVMAALGYGSVTIGATTNSVQIFNDAKAKGLSNTLAASFAVGNILAAATGGILGRGLVKSFASVDASATNTQQENQVVDKTIDEPVVVESPDVPADSTENQLVDDTASSKESIVTEPEEAPVQSTPADQTSHTEIHYTQSGLDNAKRIAYTLYRDDVSQLQKHVEMVEQYNLSHGTNIDPYRAVMLRADAGGRVPSNYEIATDSNGGTRFTNGNVKVFGAGWLKSNPEFTTDDIHALRDVFNGDVATDAGMKVMERMELAEVVSEKNQVGSVAASIKTLNGKTTYSIGTSAIVKEIVMVPDEVVAPDTVSNNPIVDTVVTSAPTPETVIDSVSEPLAPAITQPVVAPNSNITAKTSGAMGMFGIFSEKQRSDIKQLRKRMGAFLDSMFVQKQK